MIAAGLAGITGLVALVLPFVQQSPAWTWDATSPISRRAAQVNAEIRHVDPQGIVLQRRPDRPVSVVGPPIHTPGGVHPLAEVIAWIPNDAESARTRVVFFWQTSEREPFRGEEQLVELTAQPTVIRFDMPAEARPLHRVGVQFPDMSGPVGIGSIRLPDVPATARFGLAWNQFATWKPLDNTSINYVRGPSILGHGLNYYLVAIASALGGAVAAVGCWRYSRIRWRGPVLMVLACWMVGDVHHSIGLARQLDVDIRSAQGKDWPQQIAEFYGPEAAWAHASLLDRTPEGATFAVAGDNVTTMAQRLAYWLAPQRTFVADWRKADFVLVFRPGEATWDEADGRFTSGSQSVAAERLATRDANLYLLRRLAQ